MLLTFENILHRVFFWGMLDSPLNLQGDSFFVAYKKVNIGNIIIIVNT